MCLVKFTSRESIKGWEAFERARERLMNQNKKLTKYFYVGRTSLDGDLMGSRSLFIIITPLEKGQNNALSSKVEKKSSKPKKSL